MDLYTMNENFIAQETIDEYVSAIWTERYWAAGDLQIVAPATAPILDKLAEGTFVGLRGTKEVMMIDTVSIENGLVTVVGSTLVEFLNQRYAWFKNAAYDSEDDPNRIADLTRDDMDPGQFIAELVYAMVIDATPYDSSWIDTNLEWDLEVIPGLELGPVDTSLPEKQLTAVTGPLYDSLQQVAEKEKVGISLYLESADPDTGYQLLFSTYLGVDRTSDQSTYPLVRLDPDQDSLDNVKEIRSIANWKNTCYVYYKGEISTHYEDPLNVPEGFNRRSIVTDPETEPVGHKETLVRDWRMGPPGTYTVTVVSPEDIEAFREQNAQDALANHNYIRAIDGETSPINDYTYGIDYGLGDVIELKSLQGNLSKARITEYIRSQDRTGYKEYPTISVVNDAEEGG